MDTIKNDITYSKLIVETFGKKKKAKPSIKALFWDHAANKPRVYNYSVCLNAIEVRTAEKQPTQGLEYGRDKMLEKHGELGIAPQESRKQRRRRLNVFVNQ